MIPRALPHALLPGSFLLRLAGRAAATENQIPDETMDVSDHCSLLRDVVSFQHYWFQCQKSGRAGAQAGQEARGLSTLPPQIWGQGLPSRVPAWEESWQLPQKSQIMNLSSFFFLTQSEKATLFG